MFKNKKNQHSLAIAVSGLLLIFSYQNCGSNGVQVSFDTVTTSLPSFDADPGEVVKDPVNPICDPFKQGQKMGGRAGMKGVLAYLDTPSRGSARIDDYIRDGIVISDSVFLPNLDIPTRRFDLGFLDAKGEPLKKPTGELLLEYFSLHMMGRLHPRDDWGDGLYQLALLSDDGSRLSVVDNKGNPQSVLIENDGLHSTHMRCGAAVDLSQEGKNLRVDYFQGPRFQIALMLMWRKVADAESIDEPLCDTGGIGHFFDPQTGAPRKAYEDLLDRGWEPVPQENLETPSGGGEPDC